MKEAHFTAFGEKCVVKAFAPKNQTASGLYLPDEQKSDPQTTGVIVALGTVENRDLKVGQQIAWKPYSSASIEIPPYEDLRIVEYKNITVIFDD